MNISQRTASMLVATNIGLLACLSFLILSGFSNQQAHFTEISAERVNIVSPEGKNVIAISNKERVAGPVIAGKQYPVNASDGRDLMAGMVFFNQDGDEMGGLLFNSFRLPNGRPVGIGHLSFDRFNDNQVLALQYNENTKGVQTGLTFYDQPANGKFKEAFDLSEEAKTANDSRLAEVKAKLKEISDKRELGGERIFVGSKNNESQLTLRDSKGHVRARLIIDKNDEAKLEFLDESGVAYAQFPAKH